MQDSVYKFVTRLEKAKNRIEQTRLFGAAVTLSASERRQVQREASAAACEFQAALGEVLRVAYPNPERLGCVQVSGLERFAHGIPDNADLILRHILRCSPCYEELLALRREHRRRLRRGLKW
jgi:hypothetical protein